MIDYGEFQFACPPRTGSLWFIEACKLTGLGYGTIEEAHELFPSNRNGCSIRVSLVRHPCDWLASCFSTISAGNGKGYLAQFYALDRASFDSFVRSYLLTFPGFIGKLFSMYKSDTCMRLEDMPWAFMEFVETFGVSYNNARLCKNLRKQNVSGSIIKWNKLLREKVMNSESDFCDRYEYF